MRQLSYLGNRRLGLSAAAPDAAAGAQFDPALDLIAASEEHAAGSLAAVRTLFDPRLAPPGGKRA
jgi:hypothetical protein